MNRKAIVSDTVRGNKTTPLPYVLEFEIDSGLESDLDDHFGSPDWRNSYRNYLAKAPAMPDGRRIWQPGPALRTDYFGTTWRMDLKPVHVEVPAISEPSLAGYKFPDVSQFATEIWQSEVAEFAAANSDQFIVIYTGFGIFERSWMLRGFQNALTDAALDPEFYSALLSAISEDYMMPLLDVLTALPVDGIMFGDDWGDQRGIILGPERFRKLLKPLYKKLYRKVRDSGKVVLHHSCGSIAEIIPDVIDIGLDVVESVQVEAQGMNPYKLKKEYGKDITFWGGLGSQSIIPFGTPDELRSEIRKLANIMGQDGGYILSCAKALQMGTPIQNAAVIVEEFVACGEPEAIST